MSKPPFTWRTIERHIEDILRDEGFELDEDKNSDKIIQVVEDMPTLNITAMAQELMERMKGS